MEAVNGLKIFQMYEEAEYYVGPDVASVIACVCDEQGMSEAELREEGFLGGEGYPRELTDDEVSRFRIRTDSTGEGEEYISETFRAALADCKPGEAAGFCSVNWD